MTQAKMTNNLVSTNKFIVTLAYPVKNKVSRPISKKQSITEEFIDAVVEVVPIYHSGKEDGELAEQFYHILCQAAEMADTKNRRHELESWIEACDERIRKEMDESCQHIHLENLTGKVEHIFVNLLDKHGNVAKSVQRALSDILSTFQHIHTCLTLWKAPKKRAPFLVPAHPVTPPKARRKERLLKGDKEGGTCRYIVPHMHNPN
jgi:hypothetical protein